ncbi:MAG: saccharopine dehydrogenase NADP-binding domain-containing protein [Cyclobacteriaceae bacterium]|nr:saccharopine dehydrogenase NADP-binding domain-containing protein [Cytophagales bacterium]MCZ8327145.1 saccharopine dehydrogenase NADP-binding domain-containing protein [Cyclobacteriaceae bacterium]
MKKILVLGAGRSSGSLITHLLTVSEKYGWHVTVADADLALAKTKVGNNPHGTAQAFDLQHTELVIQLIQANDLVVSLLPASLHQTVATYCLAFNKHLFTASYVSAEMKALHAEVKQKGLLFLNECGLDPGIDHMTAMELLDDIRKQGGEIQSFESFTGGLLAPESDMENPWRYKFTWNPRNVVMAGQGTAKYLEDGTIRYVPYQQLFRRTTSVSVPGIGLLDGYPNRDSLQYLSVYGLDSIKTMIRGTLRFKGYCQAWYILSQLGVCDETHDIELENKTHEEFMQAFLPAGHGSAEDKLDKLFPDYRSSISLLKWSGFFDSEKFTLSKATPAKAVEVILSRKWTLTPNDKDLIVMWHRIGYTLHGHYKHVQAALTATGINSDKTAMADTVGLPLALATELFLLNKFTDKGVVIPIKSNIYQPVLAGLKERGITMQLIT